MTDQAPPVLAPARRRQGAWARGALALATLVIALLAWALVDVRANLAALRAEVAERLREAGAKAEEARAIAREMQESVRDVQGKIGALEARQLEARNQAVALQTLYQELSRGRDEWTLAEIEQTLAIAAQQLQLAGNVRAALAALQIADARLARSDRPQFVPVRRVFARDIERLKAAPDLDVVGMTVRIDQIIAAVDQLALLADGRPPPEPKPAAEVADDASGWTRWWRPVWDELKALVRVQRLDAGETALLAPEARYFLRENLKLRLLHARLALLQRDETAFRADVRAAQGWINRYFDPRQKAVQAAAAALAQLNTAAVSVELPTINDSLTAVRNLKSPRERPAG